MRLSLSMGNENNRFLQSSEFKNRDDILEILNSVELFCKFVVVVISRNFVYMGGGRGPIKKKKKLSGGTHN